MCDDNTYRYANHDPYSNRYCHVSSADGDAGDDGNANRRTKCHVHCPTNCDGGSTSNANTEFYGNADGSAKRDINGEHYPNSEYDTNSERDSDGNDPNGDTNTYSKSIGRVL